MSKLKTQLESSVVEKDNENFWRAILSKEIEGSKINSPFGGDGLLEAVNPTTKKDLRTILEFKYETQLKSKLTQCNILIQVLYYIKKYENAGQKLPSTIFVGDTDECFAIHTNQIIKYLGHDVDWKIAPSEAHKKNPELMKLMVDDVDILPFVYDVDNEFKIKEVIEKLWDLTDNVVRKIRITKDNIVNIYDYFNDNVLKDCELTTNEKANLFIQIAINPSENYIHPKKSVVVTKSYGEVHINRNQFKSFFSHFEGDIYSPKEKEGLTALVDRLVEEETRRKKGEFFTPTAFVNLAHTYISNTFGEDWRERFVVWDNSCGTMNLTRDYKFKELYCSTLEQSDIDTANQMRYNLEATKFQYDFLNGDYDVLPEGLRNAIDGGKEILFLINPPYGKPTPINNLLEDNKSVSAGMTTTKIQNEMKKEKIGLASSNLYTQFLYRIGKLQDINKNIKIGLFSPPGFLASGSNKEFRKYFLPKFNYKNGYRMDSSNFADVQSWGLSFTIFDSQTNVLNDFKVDVVDKSKETFSLEKINEKVLYNTDNLNTLSKWFGEIKTNNDIDFPVLESVFKVNDISKKGCSNAIGYINNDSNNVQQQNVIHIFTAVCKANGNKPITPNNFDRAMVTFSSRKMIRKNWVQWYDEFLKPNVEHKEFKQFTYDSIVFIEICTYYHVLFLL